jgi:hypothetical protein
VATRTKRIRPGITVLVASLLGERPVSRCAVGVYTRDLRTLLRGGFVMRDEVAVRLG